MGQKPDPMHLRCGRNLTLSDFLTKLIAIYQFIFKPGQETNSVRSLVTFSNDSVLPSKIDVSPENCGIKCDGVQSGRTSATGSGECSQAMKRPNLIFGRL